MIEFNRVVDGINRYIDSNIYSGMNDWQEILARIAVGRFFDNQENIKKTLIENGYIKTFAIMDANGNVDVENLGRELKREIERKGQLSVSIPLFGKMTFTAKDVNELYREITGGELSE